MIKDKENRDKMECDWCGKYEYNIHMERNFADDLCCFDCIDEANEETAIIKTISDIDRLSYNEINKLLHELLPHLNITSATKICELLNQIVVDIRRQ